MLSERSLRVALVTDFFPPAVGGVEVQVYGLARALHRRGHVVRVITTARTGAPDDGFDVVRLPFSYVPRTRSGVPSRANYRRLVAAVADVRPDVVHAHGLFSTLAMGGVLAARRFGIPSVMTHHSLIRAYSMPAAALIYLFALRHADVVTAVSEAAAREARLVACRNEVLPLPNGLGVGPAPGAPARADDPTRVTSVLRFKLKKLPYHLMWDFSRILARVAEPSRVRFTVVGDGPERGRVERLAAMLGLRGHVEFCGERSRGEVDRILADSSIFVSPVRAEAFGLALLEARAAGLPCVAIDGGGVSEVIEHGRHGLLASTRAGLVEAVVRLVDDPRLRAQLAAGAREGIERYGWEAVCERYEEVYRLAIERRARKEAAA